MLYFIFKIVQLYLESHAKKRSDWKWPKTYYANLKFLPKVHIWCSFKKKEWKSWASMSPEFLKYWIVNKQIFKVKLLGLGESSFIQFSCYLFVSYFHFLLFLFLNL